MIEKIINQLANCSDQELDIITKKAYAIRTERRNVKIEELKKNFLKTWEELRKLGVDIYYIHDDDDEMLDPNDISFDN